MAKKHKGKTKIYRLALIDDTTHEPIRGLRFTRTVGIIFGITAAVVMLGISYCIVAFTPIRQTIPGYPDAYSKKLAIENAIKIDSLENVILRWELYSENLHHVLKGEKTISLDSVVRTHSTKYLKHLDEDQMHRQDSIIKEKVKQ